jgi:hypothetical protein
MKLSMNSELLVNGIKGSHIFLAIFPSKGIVYIPLLKSVDTVTA